MIFFIFREFFSTLPTFDPIKAYGSMATSSLNLNLRFIILPAIKLCKFWQQFRYFSI